MKILVWRLKFERERENEKEREKLRRRNNLYYVVGVRTVK